MDGGVRDRRHPYRQCVSAVNAWLIVWSSFVWSFSFIVNMFVTMVEVGGKIDGWEVLNDTGDGL
jgi:hypothetical protein